MKRLILRGRPPVNCFIFNEGDKCFIVDPGYQAERLQETIKELGFTVEGILLTHGHHDHVGAANCFDVPVYITKKSHKLIMDFMKDIDEDHERHPGYDISKLNFVFIDKDFDLQLNGKRVEIFETPGHTSGGVCYKFGNDLYAGDTLFCGVVGRWDFPTGNQLELRESVNWLIENLDECVEVHPGHGKSSNIGQEKISNEFYLGWKDGLIF